MRIFGTMIHGTMIHDFFRSSAARRRPSSPGRPDPRVVVLPAMKLHLWVIPAAAFTGLLAVSGCSKVSEAAVEPASRTEAPSTATPQASTVDNANYTATLTFEGACKKGETCTALVTVEAKGGYHINDKYPYRFKLSEPPAGVSYPKAVVGREDGTFTEKKAVLRVPFVATNAGEAKVGGTLSFSVCSDEKCLIDKQALEAIAKVQ